MFDSATRRFIDPALARLAAPLARAGVGADAVTAAGLAASLVCAGLVAAGATGLALLALALSRLADGLDGAIARIDGKTDRGGYLDIVFDFVFYGAAPFGFALLDPAQNALPAAALLFAFYVNGAAFLAFAAIAARRGLETRAQGEKSFYYVAGLAEGAETIAVFAAMMIWPSAFPALAFGFAALCGLSAVGRVALAWRLFR
ncbi:MAG: CDP-alcohol phosphatidyltransferase family protein [Methylobacteriaceae bacterium]|nr:CDP-alcohol phosphatidyltransferase family protein [Methylobacteriaceae bacterium]